MGITLSLSSRTGLTSSQRFLGCDLFPLWSLDPEIQKRDPSGKLVDRDSALSSLRASSPSSSEALRKAYLGCPDSSLCLGVEEKSSSSWIFKVHILSVFLISEERSISIQSFVGGRKLKLVFLLPVWGIAPEIFTELETPEKWFLLFWVTDPFKNLIKIMGLSSGEFRSTKTHTLFRRYPGTPWNSSMDPGLKTLIRREGL